MEGGSGRVLRPHHLIRVVLSHIRVGRQVNKCVCIIIRERAETMALSSPLRA